MPAILPSKDGKCPIIVRVDGGLLREIGTNFLLRLSCFAVPEGSVLVIGSVTHLMEEGRVGYTKAQGEFMNEILSRVFWAKTQVF